jgi:hypothetical protein
MIQLTIVYPRAAERQVLAELLDAATGLGGFTTLHASGHGQGFERASIEEQVSGRAARGVLVAVMAEDDARALVAVLRERLPSREIAYWLAPVLDFGRFGE